MTIRALSVAAIAIVATFAACRNEAIVISSEAEIAAHRQFVLTTIRGADGCVDAIQRSPEIGYDEALRLTLQVDRNGQARLVDLQTTSITDIMTVCRRQIEAAVSQWKYQPFEHEGRATTVQIVERVRILPAERWRTPRREFPQIDNIESVTITSRRDFGLVACGNGRIAYIVQIRGNGDVTIRERLHGSVEGGPFEVEGPTHRSRIDRDAVESLIAQFHAADFFSLEEEYVSGITDQPGQTLTFETDADRANVTDYVGETVGMPLVVRDLEVAIDATAGSGPLRCA